MDVEEEMNGSTSTLKQSVPEAAMSKEERYQKIKEASVARNKALREVRKKRQEKEEQLKLGYVIDPYPSLKNSIAATLPGVGETPPLVEDKFAPLLPLLAATPAPVDDKPLTIPKKTKKTKKDKRERLLLLERR